MAAAAAALCVGCTATADDDYARPGFYLGAGALYAPEDFDVDDFEQQVGADVNLEDSWGADARAGFRFHPHFAVEGVFQYYDEFEFEFDAGGVDLGKLHGWSATGNLKGYLATGPFQPYLVGGVGAVHFETDDFAFGVDVDETDLLLRGGAGFDLYLHEHLALYGEGAYNVPVDDLEDLNYFSVVAGLLFRF